jgi:hypothetical protein
MADAGRSVRQRRHAAGAQEVHKKLIRLILLCQGKLGLRAISACWSYLLEHSRSRAELVKMPADIVTIYAMLSYCQHERGIGRAAPTARTLASGRHNRVVATVPKRD